MKRKIKFPLKMNGKDIRTLEELRENFDFEEVIKYYIEGKLQRWLKDRDYIVELEQISELDQNKKNFKKDIFNVFKVKYKEKSKEINVQKIVEENNKIVTLKQYTDDENIINNIDKIAFNQNELEKIKLSESNRLHRKIYLCGEEFYTDDTYENIEYIGINRPSLFLSSKKDIFDANKRSISFKNLNIKSNQNLCLRIKDLYDVDIDKNNIKILNIIEAKYNKTIQIEMRGGLFLDNDGKVNSIGCSFGGSTPSDLPKIVSIEVDMLYDIVLALSENGKVYQWGFLPYGFDSVPKNLPKIKQISLGGDFMVALGENGKIYHWGGWDYEKVFIGLTEYGREVYKPMPKIKERIMQIECRYSNVFALDEKGKMYSWGYYNCLASNNIPNNLPPLKKIVVDKCADWVLALDEYGKIHHWGKKEYGIEKIPRIDIPIVDISCDGVRYSALDENGKMHIWGIGWKESIDEVNSFPKIKTPYGHGGIDEEGKTHNIRYGVLRENVIDIKVMNPIR